MDIEATIDRLVAIITEGLDPGIIARFLPAIRQTIRAKLEESPAVVLKPGWSADLVVPANVERIPKPERGDRYDSADLNRIMRFPQRYCPALQQYQTLCHDLNKRITYKDNAFRAAIEKMTPHNGFFRSAEHENQRFWNWRNYFALSGGVDPEAIKASTPAWSTWEGWGDLKLKPKPENVAWVFGEYADAHLRDHVKDLASIKKHWWFFEQKDPRPEWYIALELPPHRFEDFLRGFHRDLDPYAGWKGSYEDCRAFWAYYYPDRADDRKYWLYESFAELRAFHRFEKEWFEWWYREDNRIRLDAQYWAAVTWKSKLIDTGRSLRVDALKKALPPGLGFTVDGTKHKTARLWIAFANDEPGAQHFLTLSDPCESSAVAVTSLLYQIELNTMIPLVDEAMRKTIDVGAAYRNRRTQFLPVEERRDLLYHWIGAFNLRFQSLVERRQDDPDWPAKAGAIWNHEAKHDRRELRDPWTDQVQGLRDRLDQMERGLTALGLWGQEFTRDT